MVDGVNFGQPGRIRLWASVANSSQAALAADRPRRAEPGPRRS
jgi:hypothetical protein